MPTKILVVEDDESVGSIDKLILESSGYSVDWLRNAKNIVHEVLVRKPDLIILDIMLPGKSGFEAFKELERGPGSSEIPILFVSVIDIPARYPKMLQRKHIAFLQKPYEMNELLEKIRQMTG